ncbi:hypothetical protein HG530_014906 [Fusarium avenaceum]|nr:hypothetical protein HG530_014906 [Fusarium avenaceum]
MPPPKGTPNPLEGPGDYDVTSVVHSDTYPAIDPTKFNLKGKTILVTGSSRGFGRAMCVAFARAGAAQIVLASRSDMSTTADAIRAVAKETGHPEPDVLSVKTDVGVPESVDALAEKVSEAFGSLDVVINNAAFMKIGSIAESDPADWLQTITANVFGPYLVARAMAPLLLKAETRTIINIASVGAHLVSHSLSAYQTSKLAIVRLTEFIALEYGDKGIVSYCVHPGNSPSEMLGGIEGVPEPMRPAFVDTPELCANSLVFLASERRTWLAGRYINVTWDLPELMSKEEEIVQGDKLKEKGSEGHRHIAPYSGLEDLEVDVHEKPECQPGQCPVCTRYSPVLAESPDVSGDHHGKQHGKDLAVDEAHDPNVADTHALVKTELVVDTVHGEDVEELSKDSHDDVDGVVKIS